MLALRLGLAFLTRVPGPPGELDARVLGASVRGWALAGPLVGLVSVGGLTLGAWAVSPAVGAILAVAAGLWLTRGLHLDGLADCFDGLLCNGDRERTLRVMHDPHVGALAAAGLSLWLLARVALVAACVERGVAFGALLLAAVVARLPLAAEVRWAVPAAPTGLLARLHAEVRPADVHVATTLGVLLALPAFALVPPAGAAVGVLLAAGATGVWHPLWVRRIGGLNGDVLGAAVELREMCVLFALGSPLLT